MHSQMHILEVCRFNVLIWFSVLLHRVASHADYTIGTVHVHKYVLFGNLKTLSTKSYVIVNDLLIANVCKCMF